MEDAEQSPFDELLEGNESHHWNSKGDSFCTEQTALESFDPTKLCDSFADSFDVDYFNNSSTSNFFDSSIPLQQISRSELCHYLSFVDHSSTTSNEYPGQESIPLETGHSTDGSALLSENKENKHALSTDATEYMSSKSSPLRSEFKQECSEHHSQEILKTENEHHSTEAHFCDRVVAASDDTLNEQSVDLKFYELAASDGVSDKISDRSFTSWEKQCRNIAKPPKTANICLNDLKRVFHLERPQAEKALNLKRTTFSNLSRHFGIAKWPYRTLRDVQKRRTANEHILQDGKISKEKRRKLLEQQENLQEVVNLIYTDPTESRDSNTLAVLLKIVEARKRGDKFC